VQIRADYSDMFQKDKNYFGDRALPDLVSI
jgi:hypothetical protein